MKLADKVRAVRVLRTAGMLDLRRPVRTAAGSLAMRRLEPIAGAAHLAARRGPGDLALIDELGELSYGDLDQRANALARGWLAAEVEPGQVIGVLCRDHRGIVDSMIACGKLGVRLVLLNTGFSRVQLADVARREGISALVHDEEFDELLCAVPATVRRFVAWGSTSDLEAMIATNDSGPLKLPNRQGGLVLRDARRSAARLACTTTQVGSSRSRTPPGGSSSATGSASPATPAAATRT